MHSFPWIERGLNTSWQAKPTKAEKRSCFQARKILQKPIFENQPVLFVIHVLGYYFQKSLKCFSFSELTRMIPKGTCHMKLDKIGKFLSAVLERTE